MPSNAVSHVASMINVLVVLQSVIMIVAPPQWYAEIAKITIIWMRSSQWSSSSDLIIFFYISGHPFISVLWLNNVCKNNHKNRNRQSGGNYLSTSRYVNYLVHWLSSLSNFLALTGNVNYLQLCDWWTSKNFVEIIVVSGPLLTFLEFW